MLGNIFNTLKHNATLIHADGNSEEIEIDKPSDNLIIVDFIKNKGVKIRENEKIIIYGRNGVDEEFIIISPTFYDTSIANYGSHYQCEIKRVSAVERENTIHGVNFGNISSNIINMGSQNTGHVSYNDTDVFNSLIKKIMEIDTIDNKDELIKVVREMEASCDNKTTYLEKYTNFVSLIALHIDAFAHFIGPLKQIVGL